MATSFADLTPDALRAVLRRLQLREVVSLSCTCSQLLALCSEEPLWRALCEAWGAAHARSPFDADAARAALRLRSFRALRRALHGWRQDPLGVWRVETQRGPRAGEPAPAGGLVLVSVVDGMLMVGSFASNANAQAFRSGGRPYYLTLAMEQFHEEDETPRDANSRVSLARLRTHRAPGLGYISFDRDDPDTLWCSFNHAFGFRNEMERLVSVHGTPNGQRAIKLRRATGLPVGWSAPPAGGGLPCRLQPGLYTAAYGPHSQEVILLRRLASTPPEQQLPAELPASAPRWEGLKISGDPNVPAGRLTFVAPDAAPIAEVMQQALSEERPILSFVNGPRLVNLRERGLSAAHPAWGQINVQPGVWAPQWVSASTLLEYAPGPGGVPPNVDGLPIAFSVLWGDNMHERFTHITDFTPFAPVGLAQMGALEWGQLKTPPQAALGQKA